MLVHVCHLFSAFDAYNGNGQWTFPRIYNFTTSNPKEIPKKHHINIHQPNLLLTTKPCLGNMGFDSKSLRRMAWESRVNPPHLPHTRKKQSLLFLCFILLIFLMVSWKETTQNPNMNRSCENQFCSYISGPIIVGYSWLSALNFPWFFCDQWPALTSDKST